MPTPHTSQAIQHFRHVCSTVAGRWSCYWLVKRWESTHRHPPLSHNIYFQWKRQLKEVGILSSPCVIHLHCCLLRLALLDWHMTACLWTCNWQDSRWVWHGLGLLLPLIVSLKSWQVSERAGGQVRTRLWYVLSLLPCLGFRVEICALLNVQLCHFVLNYAWHN